MRVRCHLTHLTRFVESRVFNGASGCDFSITCVAIIRPSYKYSNYIGNTPTALPE